MLLKNCTFESERLLVKEWHSPSRNERRPQDLPILVASMLTEPVTRWLLPAWQGNYTLERASEWIRGRDEEGTTLLVFDKSTFDTVGLMILFEMPSEEDPGNQDVHLGYLLSEATWGKGIASELVEGFVSWCRDQGCISSISGGVAHDNLASKRVLVKNGFQVVRDGTEVNQGEHLYRLSFS